MLSPLTQQIGRGQPECTFYTSSCCKLNNSAFSITSISLNFIAFTILPRNLQEAESIRDTVYSARISNYLNSSAIIKTITMTAAKFSQIPAFTISLTLIKPLLKTTALGGVLTGSMKAQLAAIVTGIVK